MKVKDITTLLRLDDDYDSIVSIRAQSQDEFLLYQCSAWAAETVYGDETALGISAGIDIDGALSITIDIA